METINIDTTALTKALERVGAAARVADLSNNCASIAKAAQRTTNISEVNYRPAMR